MFYFVNRHNARWTKTGHNFGKYVKCFKSVNSDHVNQHCIIKSSKAMRILYWIIHNSFTYLKMSTIWKCLDVYDSKWYGANRYQVWNCCSWNSKSFYNFENGQGWNSLWLILGNWEKLEIFNANFLRIGSGWVIFLNYKIGWVWLVNHTYWSVQNCSLLPGYKLSDSKFMN